MPKKINEYKLLMSEWDYEKNKMKPSEVLLHSGKKVWWICPNGHSYQADPNHRSQGRGCPICYKNGGIKHV